MPEDVVDAIGDPILAVADPTHGTLWIADGSWARANPAVLTAWRTSLTEAADYIGKNSAESRAILSKYTKLPEQIVNTIPIPPYNAVLSARSLEPWVTALTELGQLTKRLDAASLIVEVK